MLGLVTSQLAAPLRAGMPIPEDAGDAPPVLAACVYMSVDSPAEYDKFYAIESKAPRGLKFYKSTFQKSQQKFIDEATTVEEQQSALAEFLARRTAPFWSTFVSAEALGSAEVDGLSFDEDEALPEGAGGDEQPLEGIRLGMPEQPVWLMVPCSSKPPNCFELPCPKWTAAAMLDRMRSVASPLTPAIDNMDGAGASAGVTADPAVAEGACRRNFKAEGKPPTPTFAGCDALCAPTTYVNGARRTTKTSGVLGQGAFGLVCVADDAPEGGGRGGGGGDDDDDDDDDDALPSMAVKVVLLQGGAKRQAAIEEGTIAEILVRIHPSAPHHCTTPPLSFTTSLQTLPPSMATRPCHMAAYPQAPSPARADRCCPGREQARRRGVRTRRGQRQPRPQEASRAELPAWPRRRPADGAGARAAAAARPAWPHAAPRGAKAAAAAAAGAAALEAACAAAARPPGRDRRGRRRTDGAAAADGSQAEGGGDGRQVCQRA